MCQNEVSTTHSKEASVTEVSIIGLDLAKHVFQAHGAAKDGQVAFRKRLRRAEVLSFFSRQPKCLVVMEACGGGHYWAREIRLLGHEVKLIAPARVKPFVTRNKTDAADAEAICEAAARSNMRFVPVKSEAAQAGTTLLRARQLLERQRTQTINALRGLMNEYGLIVPQGRWHVERLAGLIEDESSALPASAVIGLKALAAQIDNLNRHLTELDGHIRASVKQNEVAKRLMTIPGVGPMTAASAVALVSDPSVFRRGRDFSAWLGLTPLEHSSGGKQKLGAISKRGERSLRRLVMLGATAVVRQALIKPPAPNSWLGKMLARKPRMVVITALANKIARVIWAIMAKGGVYRERAEAMAA
jgi:transposase